MNNSNHSIQIVLVLYKTNLEDSLSYRTLCDSISVLSFNYELLIYNNSPEYIIKNKSNYIIFNAKNNEMLVGAYNYALQRAKDKKRNWLLLLDQDTCLSKEYFEQINMVINFNENIVAIIPMLQNTELHLSPISYYPLLGPWLVKMNINKTGFLRNKTINAFNSTAILSVNALEKIGGFSNEFPLDHLDYYIFYQLSKNGGYFYVMNVILQHNLSVLDYKNKMTSERYISIIDSEFKFSKLLGILSVITFKLKLILRIFKQLLLTERRPYIFITLKYLYKL